MNMIRTEIQSDVAVITLDNPPVNAIGADTRSGLWRAIGEAEADPAVRAIVLRGAGKQFSAGADITEFGKPVATPFLPDVVDRIEACAKPVVAAIHGSCLGGGLEVALGSHYRIAAPSARLGLPEVKIGVLPGAGGTQRLPRLVGLAPALDIIVSGDPVSAAKGLEIGLVDKVVEENRLTEEAILLARSMPGVRRIGDMSVPSDPGVFDRFTAQNARMIGNLDAPRACIEAVRFATDLPVDEGQLKERELFFALMNGEQSKALRHIFFAERAAAKVDDLPADTKTRPVGRVGVIGAGTMGGGISMNFLSAGIPVTIIDMNAEALGRGVAVIRRNYDASAAKGRMTTAQVERAMGLLEPTLDLGALADCDLIIEAVYEDMAIKKDIFGRIDRIAKAGAILASNTSYLDVDEIASATSRPADVVGMHFFSPANVMRLLEVVRGARTAPDVLATSMAIGRRIGKVPVVARVCHGFIGNRMLSPRQDQADALLLAGASPKQIDAVHTDFGMPMGPFQMIDLAGVDLGWHRDPARIATVNAALCAVGRWGQKTGKGYYDYDDRRRPSPSAEVDAIVADFRGRAGIAPREVGTEEIVVRTLYTMVNEAAFILEEGIAQRASDIDVVWAYGYGWPRHRGGPMHWADSVGLGAIVAGLERHRDALGPDFKLSALLLEKAKSNGRFT